MKKYIFIIINLVIVLIVLASYKESRKFVDPGAKNFIRGEVKELEELAVDISYDSTLSEKSVKEIEEAIKSMPADVIKSFVDNGWRITVTGEVSENGLNREELENISGTCDFDNKIIRMKLKGDGLSRHYYICAVHELSHYADAIYGNISRTNDFKDLFEEYKDVFVEYELTEPGIAGSRLEYTKKDPEEFFACTMKDFIANPDYLRENYVELYVFIKNLIDKGDVKF